MTGYITGAMVQLHDAMTAFRDAWARSRQAAEVEQKAATNLHAAVEKAVMGGADELDLATAMGITEKAATAWRDALLARKHRQDPLPAATYNARRWTQ